MTRNSSAPRSLGYLAGSISQFMADSLHRNFLAEGFDLTHAQYVLLTNLFEQDGLTQQALADKVFKDKAAVKRTVDTLVEKGLVVRESTGGARNNPVRLTGRARELEGAFRKVAARTLSEATRGIAPEELEPCLSVLRRLHARFEEARG